MKAELLTLTDSDIDGFANVIIARGPGSGIIRPQITVRDAGSIADVGERQVVLDFPSAVDKQDLIDQATARLAELSDPAKFQSLSVRVTGDDLPAFRMGQKVRVSDGELGFTTTAKVQEIEWGADEVVLHLGDAPTNLLDVINQDETDERNERALGLPAPTGLRVTSVVAGIRIRVNPFTESRAVGVEVHVSAIRDFVPDASTVAIKGPGTDFTIGNLREGGRYFVRARAFDAKGDYSPFTPQASGVAGSFEWNIPEGSVSITELADSLNPPIIVESLPILPDPDWPPNTLVFSITDGKLYKANPAGTDWVPVVNTADLDGEIIASQIADEAVEMSKLAGDLRAPQLVAALPVLPDAAYPPDALVVHDGKLYKNASNAWVPVVNTTDLVGEIIASQIAEGAISAEKMAANLQVPAVVSSKPGLPDADYPLNSLVLYGGKLFKNEGNSWVSVVNTNDLEGQITGTQIEDNAITTGKLAANSVKAGQIAAGAVTAGKLDADAVTAGTIAAGAVTAGKLAANAVTASKIDAGAVTADKLAANAVTAGKVSAGAVTSDKLAANAVIAEKIAANAVTANKLLAGSVSADKLAGNAVTAGKLAADAVTAGTIAAAAIGTRELAANAVTAGQIAAGAVTASKVSIGGLGNNLILNPEFVDGADGWSGLNNIYDILTPNGTLGVNTVRIKGDNANYLQFISNYFNVVPGRSYVVSGQKNIGAGFQILIRWYLANGTTSDTDVFSGPPYSVWSEYAKVVTAPVGAAQARYYFRSNPNAGSNTYGLIANPSVTEAVDTRLLVDGAIEISNADKNNGALLVKNSGGTELLRLGNITGKSGVPTGTQFGLWGKLGTGVFIDGAPISVGRIPFDYDESNSINQNTSVDTVFSFVESSLLTILSTPFTLPPNYKLQADISYDLVGTYTRYNNPTAASYYEAVPMRWGVLVEARNGGVYNLYDNLPGGATVDRIRIKGTMYAALRAKPLRGANLYLQMRGVVTLSLVSITNYV